MNNCKRRGGFTILELVVVMAVLVVLAGLIVAVMPNLMDRAHLTKCADTIAELNKTWLRAYALNVRYPDVYDSLLDASQAEPAFLAAGVAAELEPADLTSGETAALAAIGVRQVVDGAPGATNTYDYAPFGAVARPLSGTPTVMALDLAAHEANGNLLNLKRHLLRQADGTFLDNRANVRYVVFGIGPNCTAVGSGKLIQEAPVHFGASDALNPTTTYQRYLVVFSVVHDGAGGYRAHFEAAAGNDIGGLSSAEVHTEGFHAATQSEG